MNSVQLVGLLEKKISTKQTKLGGSVTNFILKIPNKKVAKDSFSYSYVLCSCFNKSSQMINEFAEVGMMVQVIGGIHESVKDIKGVKVRTLFVICDKVAIYQDVGASSDVANDFIIEDSKHPLELNGNASNFNENDK